MKRSKSLSLILMGTLALGSTGCSSDEEETYQAFSSVTECVNSGLFSESECDSFASSALSQAPSFADKAECERAFGAGECQGASASSLALSQTGTQPLSQNNATTVRPATHSSWAPMMMGFMAARFMGGGGMMQGSQPLFRDKAPQGGAASGPRSFRTATGDTITPDSKGAVKSPPSQIKQNFSHNAKPAMSRTGSSSFGGFSGGKAGGMGGGS